MDAELSGQVSDWTGEDRATYVVAAGDDAADEVEDMEDEEVVGIP